jgi:hypothetical protein
LFWIEFEAMETKFGSVKNWPGDLPHGFTSMTQPSFQAVFWGQLPNVIWPNQDLLWKEENLDSLRLQLRPSGWIRTWVSDTLFCTLQLRGASHLSTILWDSFFIGNRKENWGKNFIFLHMLALRDGLFWTPTYGKWMSFLSQWHITTIWPSAMFTWMWYGRIPGTNNSLKGHEWPSRSWLSVCQINPEESTL